MNSSFRLPKFSLNITALDISPNGQYIFAACDSGDILCFPISNNSSKEYVVIGKIASKSFQTVQTTLKVSEDSKYCFVGTRKGTFY